MSARTFEHALGIELETREPKPRRSGINMVIDFCQPWQVVEGYLDAWSDYVDFVKLTEAHLYPADSRRRAEDQPPAPLRT